uniref:Olfactory receptor n=1 Tax=Chrysemys picta bellii TaxID=8478 RepID=A0A8C3FM10_CHRPI
LGMLRAIKNTSVTEFVILGFSNHRDMNLILFVVFLCIYIVTVLGNILIIVVIYVDPTLRTPMYFFLRNLSFLDLCYVSVTLPKMLANLLSENKNISFSSCAVQMFFFLFFGITECFLLASMAYDRYNAICNPLRYTAIMNKRVCIQLTGGSWICGTLVAVGHTTSVFTLPFCGSNVINHFFCDIQPLLKLVSLTSTVLFVVIPFALILWSYVCILATILKMPSAEGRRKTFSTCSSHLTVVVLLFSTTGLTYFQPKSSSSPSTSKFLSLCYTILTPLLNPVVYSLRNNEMKGILANWFLVIKTVVHK